MEFKKGEDVILQTLKKLVAADNASAKASASVIIPGIYQSIFFWSL
jgi:hypothetical protein